MKTSPRVLLLCVFLSILTSVGSAATLYVPGSYSSIQAAINNANDFDEIEVAPGTYGEAINFYGKSVRLYSSGGAEATIIDATGLSSSVVICTHEEGSDTILEGFTITGGDAAGGGGMVNQDSSPTVTDCIFTGNAADDGGGAMANWGGSPTVTNCTFSNNTSPSASGGGMNNVDSSPTVTDCIFTGNAAGDAGGAMSNFRSSPTVTNCTFSNNTSPSGSGGMSNHDSSPTVTNCTFSNNTSSASGGGMYNLDSSPTVNNCIFSGNTAWGVSNGGGGGMYSLGGSPTVINCTFDNNRAVDGGGMYNNSSSPTVSNCIFSRNRAWLVRFFGGGGMYNSGGSVTVINCTFYYNLAFEGGGIYNEASNPIVTNCILWGDRASFENSNEIHNYESTPNVSYSDIQGGWESGTGNIDADPLFRDLRLQDGSPCIDAADGDVAPETDRLGNLRYDHLYIHNSGAGEPDYVDMGAHEFQGPSGIAGAVIGIDPNDGTSGPLTGAIIVLNSQETVSDPNGSFRIPDLIPGDYTMTVTKGGYYDVIQKIKLGEHEVIHKVIKLAKKTVSQIPIGFDFTSPNGMHFLEGAPGNIGFKITIVWNGSPGQVYFNVGNERYLADVSDLGGGLATAEVTINANDILSCPDALTIEIVNGKGNTTYLSTDVRFHPVPEIIDCWYGANNVSSWKPSGLAFSYSDSKEWSWDLPLKSDDVSLEATVGYGRSLSYDLMSGTFSGSLQGTGGFGLQWPVSSVTILGSGDVGLTGNLDISFAGGEPVITPSWEVSFSGKAGIEAPVVVAVEVLLPPAAPVVQGLRKIPVVKSVVNALKVRVFLIGGASIAGTYEDGFGDCFLGSTQIDVSGTIGVEGQVELSIGRAGVGVYAGGTGTPSFEICPDFQFNSMTLRAYVGAYAYFYWFKVSKEVGCTITIGNDDDIQTLSASLLAPALEGDFEWEPVAESMRQWGPANRPVDTILRTMSSTSGITETNHHEQTIAENVIPTASPDVVSDISETRLLFTLFDNSDPNGFGVSDIGTFTSNNGQVWSMGRITEDDDWDSVAKIIPIDSNEYLATWERRLGSTFEVPDPNDPNYIDPIGLQLEISTSRYNRSTGQWSEATMITSNDVEDRAPLPIQYGSTEGIVWIQTTQSEDRLMFSKWTGSEWKEPNELWSGYHIVSISFASDGTKQGHIVFDVDLDGDIDATKTDRELFTISSTTAGSWTDAERLTINDVEDSLPVIVNPNGTAILVWDSNDTLLYTPLINSWNPKQVYSQYTLSNQAATLDGVTMDGGAAIGYTVQTPSGVDIMASFYDVNLDRWSLPRQLTFDEDVESAISLGFDGTRLVVAYLKTETERNEVDAEIEGQIYHLENVPQPGRTDLCLLHHTLGYDFSIDANSIVFEPNENPKPSSNQKIWATVENMGDLSSDVTVEFYDGDPDSGGSLIGNPIIINDLIPGGRYQVSVDWQVPDFSEAHEIYVVVDPDLKVDDRDRSNNVASKFTVLPDMVVVNTWSANLSAHSMMLIARITNIGVSPAKEVTVSWKMDSPQGIEIGRDMITILRPDGAYEASCVWDANAITSGEEYVQIFGHVSASDSAPDVDEDNNIFTLVIKNPRPLNQPPIADAGEDIIAYALVDGLAQVKLDGTGSYDLDADELDHFWYSDVNDLIATGVEPNVILPVGKHIISLVVNDGFFDSEPNDVVITVIEPLEVSLKVTPQTLNCRSKGNWVEAHFKLPESLTATDVDSDKSVMINSWDIESIPLMKIFLNEDGITEITASFDRQAVCSLSDNWPDMLTIFGFLTNGQIFYGNSEIRINPAGLKEMSELASYWLSGCGPPKWCDGLDLNRDTIVNMQDYPLLLNSEVGFSGE